VEQLKTMELSDCEKIGLGARRPEDVAVSATGEVWLSDQGSACARVDGDGSLARTGAAGGAPNGINFDLEGRIVIANFGGPEDGRGPLQRLDPVTGEVEVICAEIEGRTLYGCNYPLTDSTGRIWCSHSTWGPLRDAFAGRDDGSIFWVSPEGEVRIVAEGIRFANGIAMDEGEEHLYVCETTGCDVLQYPIAADGSLGAPTRYGPKLGLEVREVQDSRPLSAEVRSQLGVTDGCGFDAAGNLWVTLVMANKVVAITPSGDVVTMLSDPEGRIMRSPTNVSWGGSDLQDLYIGSIATNYVLKVRTPIPGMPMAYQQGS
jgi:gluconolactonase